MDEDEPGELVDGRLEEEEVPGLVHELVVGWLAYIFHAWLAPPRAGLHVRRQIRRAARRKT